jgi:hypothetical protein
LAISEAPSDAQHPAPASGQAIRARDTTGRTLAGTGACPHWPIARKEGEYLLRVRRDKDILRVPILADRVLE